MSQAAPVMLTEGDRKRVIIGVLIAMFVAALDQTIVAPALPTIGRALGDPLWSSWVIAAYFLTSTAMMPLSGKLSDLKGRRPVLYAALGVFRCGSLICALAPSMAVLIAGRAIQGMGGGGLVAAVQTIMGDVAPPRERARYTIYISTLWAVASLAGPVLGGWLTEHLHWSMIFWINLPLCALGFLTSSRALARLPQVRRAHKLDIAGAVMVTSATVLLLLALTWAGTIYPWASWQVAGPIAASILIFGLFGWYQSYPEEPLLPPRLLANPVIAAACGAAFFSTACLIGLSVYFPLYLQVIEGFGPAASGAALVALMGGGVVGSNWSGMRMHRSPRYKRVALAGSVLAALVLTSLGLSVGRAPSAALVAMVGLAGFGFGTLFPVTLLSVQNAAEQRDLGIATATLGFLRSLGSVLSLAALSAIGGAGRLSGSLEGQEVMTAAAERGAIEAFRWVFLAIAVSQVMSVICLLAMAEKPLRSTHSPQPAEL